MLQVYLILPRPLNNDPRFIQRIYRYSQASKRFVDVYPLDKGLPMVTAATVTVNLHVAINFIFLLRKGVLGYETYML